MNIEDISKKLKKFSKDTMTEVQKLNEVCQLNTKVNDEKKKLNSIYMEMGKKLYNMYKESPLEGFEDEIHTIQEKFSMIDLLQDQIRAVKGVALCPCCNTEVGLGERFCSNCGGRMPEVFTIEEDDEILLEPDAVKEVIEEVTETVAEKAEEVKAAAEEKAEEVAEAAAEKAEEVKEAAAEVVKEAAEAVKEAAENVAETVEAAAEKAAETEETAAEEDAEKED